MPKGIEKPAAEPQLVGVHNLSQEGLQHADRLGGLAAPSLAVIHHQHAFDNFGDVSLVAGHDLVDPKKTPVFNADVYSPRQPRANYKVNGKALRQFREWVKPYGDRIGGAYTDDLDGKISTGGAAEAARDYKLDTAMKLAWLKEAKGHGPEVPKTAARLKNDWAAERPMQDFLAAHGHPKGDVVPGSDYHRGFSQAMADSFVAHRDRINAIGGDDGDIIPPAWVDRKRANHLEDNYPDPGMQGLVWHHEIPSIAADAAKAGQQETDYGPYASNIDAAVEKRGRPDYESWRDAKLAPMQGDPYLPKTTAFGNRRQLPYDMTGVLREMTRGVRNQEGFNYGPGSARSMGAKKFRDVDDMRAGGDKLVDGETMDKEKEAINSRFSEVAAKLAPYHASGNDFGFADTLVSALGQSFKRGASLKAELAKDGFDVKKIPDRVLSELHQFGKDLLAAPTQYFEAKPQRAVGLNEFHGAVVPHDVRPETMAVLKRHGITDVERYVRGDREARRAAVEKLARRKKLMLSEVELGLEPLQKMQTPPVFPGLGITGVRSQTPVVNTSAERESKIRGGIAAQRYQADRDGGFERPNIEFLKDPPRGAVFQGVPADVHSSYAQGNALGRRTALGTAEPTAPTTDLATQQHEDFHKIMGEVEARHGRDTRRAVAQHLVSSVRPEHRSALNWFADTYVAPRYDRTSKDYPEEVVGNLHNYLNDPHLRTKLTAAVRRRWPDEYANIMRGVDNGLKGAHRRMREVAAAITPGYLRTVLRRSEEAMAKSEDLAKMALIHDDPETPKTVYRIQDANGDGPYDSPDYGGAQTKMSLPTRCNAEYYQPLPEDDFTPADMREFDGQDEETGKGGGYYQFGFEEPHHAERWFGRDGIEALYNHGYRLKALPASKIYASEGNGRQVFFEGHASTPEPAAAPDAEDFDHPTPPPKVKKPRLPRMRKSEAIDKAISDIPAGAPMAGRPEAHDYSHLLAPQHRAAGLGLHVEDFGLPSGGRRLRAVLTGGHPVGNEAGISGHLTAMTNPAASSMRFGVSEVAPEHRGGGLGGSMYEAAMAHAHHAHGVQNVAGGLHSTMASRVHGSLASRHGTGYAAQLAPGRSAVSDGDDPASDNRFGAYSYPMHKSEIEKAEPLRPDSSTPSEPGYVYHATNEERAHDIADAGALKTHLPNEFTDQDSWPDGGEEKRSYHSRNAGGVWAFAPEDGRRVVLRTAEAGHPFAVESSTRDLYSRQPIPAHKLEIGLDDGRWAPLLDWHNGLAKSEDPDEVRVALVLVTSGDGRILLGRRADNGKMAMPGGHLDDGETPDHGARRELLEETGCAPTTLVRLAEIPAMNGNPHLFCYSATISGVPTNAGDPDQEIDPDFGWQWIDVRGGIPQNIYDSLHGPLDDSNLLRRVFDLQKDDSRVWLDAGFAALAKAVTFTDLGAVEAFRFLDDNSAKAFWNAVADWSEVVGVHGDGRIVEVTAEHETALDDVRHFAVKRGGEVAKSDGRLGKAKDSVSSVLGAPVEQEDWTDDSGPRHVDWHTSPFPFRRKPQLPGRDENAARAAAKIEPVSLVAINASQRRVTGEGVRRYLSGPAEPPLVYAEPDGRFTVGDGHHRITAAHVRGDDSISARVVRSPLIKASYNHVHGDPPDPHVNFVFPDERAGSVGWRGPRRPRVGFDTAQDPNDVASRPGHVYRGISGAEHDDIARSGQIKSNQSACLRDGSEGTCFGDDFGTAEGYTNFGSTNPARLGKPNYVIEVQHGPEIKVDPRDHYPKALQPVPATRITRAWRYRNRQTPEEGTWGAQGFEPTQKSEDLEKADKDPYLYHVTTANRLHHYYGIAANGLRGGLSRGIGTSAYDANRGKKRVFLTAAAGISHWHHLAERHAFDRHDDPVQAGAVPIVLRTPRTALVRPRGDAVANGESIHSHASFVTHGIAPEHLQAWSGQAWEPVSKFRDPGSFPHHLGGDEEGGLHSHDRSPLMPPEGLAALGLGKTEGYRHGVGTAATYRFPDAAAAKAFVAEYEVRYDHDLEWEDDGPPGSYHLSDDGREMRLVMGSDADQDAAKKMIEALGGEIVLPDLAKAELDPDLTEVQRLLRHPDPAERAFALKLPGTTPDDLRQALLDPDDAVYRAAFAHPAAPLHELLASPRDAAGNPIHDRHDDALHDPRCTPADVAAAYDAVADDADLPVGARAARLAAVAAHPLYRFPDDPLRKHWGHDVIAAATRNPDLAGPHRQVVDASAETPHPSAAADHAAWLADPPDADEPIYGQKDGGGIRDAAPDFLHDRGNRSKVLYEHRGARYVVKPYHDRDTPLAGWAEATSQALHHAAALGDLHQTSFVVDHDGTPATAIRIDPAMPAHRATAAQTSDPEFQHALPHIGAMDFLADSADRHHDNLMVRPDGTPLLIDHAGSFQYAQPNESYSAPGDIRQTLPEQAYGADVANWWPGVSGSVRAAMQQRLPLIADRGVRAHVAKNFDRRAAALDAFAASGQHARWRDTVDAGDVV